MDSNMQSEITVIVVTYGALLADLLQTVSSVLQQVDVKYDIVVSDDGSPDNHFKELKRYFESVSFDDYKLVPSLENSGTVRNLARGIEVAESNIIKPLSPGDYLYDRFVLSKIVAVMQRTQAPVVFGKAVYYSTMGNGCEIHNRRNPQIMLPYKLHLQRLSSKLVQKHQILYRDLVLGAAVAYRLDKAKAYIEVLIKAHVKYCEDYMVQVALLERDAVGYLDEFIVWYEYGSGISTQKENRWNSELMAEERRFLDYMNSCYPENKYLSKKRNVNCRLFKLAFKLSRKVYRCRAYDMSLLIQHLKALPMHNYEFLNGDSDKNLPFNTL